MNGRKKTPVFRILIHRFHPDSALIGSAVFLFALLWGGFLLSLETALISSGIVLSVLYGVKKHYRYSDFWPQCLYDSLFENRGIYHRHEKNIRLRRTSYRRYSKRHS